MDNPEKLNQYLSDLKRLFNENYPLSRDEWEVLKKTVKQRRVKKHVTILQNGDRELFGRYIISGVIKITSYSGDPYIYDFISAGNYLCDIVSLVKQYKTEFSFETVTDCTWLEIDAHSLIRLNAKITNAFSMMAIEHIENEHKRNTFLRIRNAEIRYLEFCRLRPNVVQVAKLGDIASFLDITQQSLSRIRRKRIGY